MDNIENQVLNFIHRKGTKSVVSGNTITKNDRGKVIELIRPNGTKTNFEYDSADRMTKSYSSDGSFCNYIYDHKGRQTHYSDDSGEFWNREYDSQDRITLYENDFGDFIRLKYDDDGNVIYYEDDIGDWWDKELLPFKCPFLEKKKWTWLINYPKSQAITHC
jgi:YD repeat-containing protein